jgi:hypothetical protein
LGARDVLTSHVKRAEQHFGPRARKFRTLKVEGRDNKTPESIPDGDYGCIVYYYRLIKRDKDRLQFQLSHEAIHVLLGSLRRDCRYIEEGLAVWFSLSVCEDSYRVKAEASLPKMFANALALFRRTNPTDEGISNLRLLSPNLDHLETNHLVKSFSIDNDLAQQLMERVPIEMELRT